MIFAFAGLDGGLSATPFVDNQIDPRKRILSPFCGPGFRFRNGGCVQALVTDYARHGLQPVGLGEAPDASGTDALVKAIIGGVAIGLLASYLFSPSRA